MKCLEVILADHTSAKTLKAYSPSDFPYLKVGATVLLINYTAELILRRNTKVARIPKLAIPVPEDIKQANLGSEVIEEIKVEQIASLPDGSLFSLKLKIIQV